MFKKLILIFLIFFAISCKENKEKAVPKIIFSKNQIELNNYFEILTNYTYLDAKKIDPVYVENLAKNENSHYKVVSYLVCAAYYAKNDSYALAKKYYEKSLVLLKNSNDNLLKGRTYNGLGGCQKNLGNFEVAFDYFYKALKIYELEKKDIGIAVAYHNLGEINQQKGDLKQSEEYLKKALFILKNDIENQVYLSASHTLANVYGMSGNYKSALEIDEKSLKICDKIKSDRLKVMFIDNKANCFMYDNKLDSAQIYFEKCLALDLKVSNKKQIADTYSNIGYLAMLQNNFPKAEALTLKSIDILQKINHKPNIISSYDNLVTIYTKQNKFEKALQAKNDFSKEYKNLINEKKEAATAEYKLVYETEKKEKLLAQNRVTLLENEAKSKKKNYVILFVSLFSILIGTVGYLIFRQQKLKNKQQVQEFELTSAISKIESQNKLQEQRLSISRDLHDNIGSQLTFIISSVENIKYGFEITNVKLDNKLTHISSFAKETILELRDTIWAMNSSEIKLEDLEIRINNFIEKAQISQENISFSFAIEECLKTKKLTSVEGMNLYRTIQEAVNNALKYAQANVISINVKQQNDSITIQIKDNGIGFDYETVEKGNGLKNMQKRIEEIGGKFSIKSNTDGTIIAIYL